MITSFSHACNLIVKECNNPFAVSYAAAGRDLEGHVAKVQALYILNNITHWRTPQAKEVRAWLKDFAKGA